MRQCIVGVLGLIGSLGCAPSPQGAEPKLSQSNVPAEPQGGSGAKIEPASPTSETTLEVQDKASRPAQQHKPKARRQALMRRFDQHESAETTLPRACRSNAAGATASAQTDPASAGASNAVATPPPVAPEANDATAADTECYPEARFVERLCAGTYPGAALVLFNKTSPWVRAYLKGPTKAWTTAPGAQDEEQLSFREEVLVLQNQDAASGGVQVSSGASFYALRWNGSCVKLTEEEVTDQVPWQKVTPPLNWQWLDDNIQTALLENEKIKASVDRMKKACKGARMGSKPAGCKAAEQQVTNIIVGQVRAGLELPDPQRRP